MNHDTVDESGERASKAALLAVDSAEQLGEKEAISINVFGWEANLPETGEARLMRAVLRDAIKCFQKYSIRPSRFTRRARLELLSVQLWFDQDDDSHALSFVNICSMLGLDPRVVRFGLETWRKKERQERSHANRIHRARKNGCPQGEAVVEGRP